jgi:hypothetical protein
MNKLFLKRKNEGDSGESGESGRSEEGKIQ